MDDLKEYADRLKFEIVAADFLSTEDREMVFDLIEKAKLKYVASQLLIRIGRLLWLYGLRIIWLR